MILLRHGEPLARDTCYGRSDPTLREPPARTAKRLGPIGFKRLLSSPSERCLALARALAPGVEPSVNPALMELDFGAWEGRRWDEIPRAGLDAWARQPLDYRMPGGESARDLMRRVDDWARRLRPGPGDLIVAHAGSLRALAAIVLRTGFETTWQWPLPYATPVTLANSNTGFVPDETPAAD